MLPLQLFSRLAITRAPAGLVTITNQKTGPFSRVFSQNVRNFPDVIGQSPSFRNPSIQPEHREPQSGSAEATVPAAGCFRMRNRRIPLSFQFLQKNHSWPHAPFVWHTMPWIAVIASRNHLIIRYILTDYLAGNTCFFGFPCIGGMGCSRSTSSASSTNVAYPTTTMGMMMNSSRRRRWSMNYHRRGRCRNNYRRWRRRRRYNNWSRCNNNSGVRIKHSPYQNDYFCSKPDTVIFFVMMPVSSHYRQSTTTNNNQSQSEFFQVHFIPLLILFKA